VKNNVSADRLDAARLVVSRMLGLKAGHACEAVAAGLGYNTHAALGAALRANERLPGTPDARRFRARLTDLGHATPITSADAALGVAFGAVPKGVTDRKAVADLVGLSGFVTMARVEILADRPAARDLLFALTPIPDASVATLLVGKDTLSWNPDFVRLLNMGEMSFLVAAAALHRAASHPLRRGERDPALWRMACDYVVNGFLIEHGVGELPKFGHYDKRFPSSMSAEDVYDCILSESRKHNPQSASDFGTWKSKPPGRLLTVAGLAGTMLRGNGGYDGFRPYETDYFREEFISTCRTAADVAGDIAGNGNSRDARADSFGRHLANLVEGMPQVERARAIAKALAEVRKSYRSAVVADLAGVGARHRDYDQRRRCPNAMAPREARSAIAGSDGKGIRPSIRRIRLVNRLIEPRMFERGPAMAEFVVSQQGLRLASACTCAPGIGR